MPTTKNPARRQGAVAVIGGGIAGLTAAYQLASEGRAVELFEASDRLGGLATWFDHEGQRLEKFYHVILDSDSYLLSLVRELGLGSRIVMRDTGMGFIVDGKPYAFNTALDLLRFAALPFLDRLRMGFGALYLTKGVRDGLPLDDVLAVDWLPRVFGRRVFERIWEPLLTAKFGERRGVVPAYWVWNLLTREKDGSQEVKAYVVGGYDGISEALAGAIRDRGGRVHLRQEVERVDADGEGVTLTVGGRDRRFTAALSSLPIPQLRQTATPTLASQIPAADLDYQGVVNVVLVTRERLTPHYWTAVVDSDFPFQGVVETTHVIPPESIGGRHLLYVLNYCGPDDPLYQTDDEELIQQATRGLGRLFPPSAGRSAFSARSVEGAYVFRASHVEPVWTRGYLAKRPEPRVGDTRLYLCTTAQAYPMITAWNTSVKLATEAVNAIRGEL